jgi:hypothetical protein
MLPRVDRWILAIFVTQSFHFIYYRIHSHNGFSLLSVGTYTNI